MSRVTSKLQVTIPKAVAEACAIRPGSEIVFEPAGEGIRVWLPERQRKPERGHQAWQLRLFDAATVRQQERNLRASTARPADDQASERGWTREALYDRGLSR
jgi:AbrB family looped-hinge helix DNA binding protein